MDLQTLLAVLSIVVIDLTISGDNALVIGMAAHRLDPRQRRLAILFGAGGAIVLRVSFTVAAALLLRVPLLQACGGVLLLWIAFKLLRQEQGESTETHHQGRNLFEAIRIIIIADAVMSLDNILAVAGASHGNISLLLFGLCLSMPIVMAGSNLVAGMIGRYSWLLPLGAGVLAYTAGGMVLEDHLLSQYLPHHFALEYGLPLLLVALVLGSYFFSRRLEALRQSSQVAGGSLSRP